MTKFFLEGKILKTKFNIYEAHIPFKLQFSIDFNIFGMEYVEVFFF
jgi:hypothetical protein